jgi:hypothetical protein
MRWLQRRTLLVAVAALALLFSPTVVRAQNDPKDVQFTTADGVEISGTFYPSSKGNKARTVLMLHDFGEHSRKASWVELAKSLQKADYAVLTFDFRGHGESTKVKPGTPAAPQQPGIPGFWDKLENASGFRPGVYVQGKPRPTEIEWKQFTPGYHRILVNDIAAAKAFLDQANDNAECNSGDLVLLGAREGATLGAVWLNSEWHRYKYLPPQQGFAGALDLQNPEGQAVVACVWLSFTDKFAGPTDKTPYNVVPTGILNEPGRKRMVPMIFFYGEGDKAGERVADTAVKFIKGKDKNADKNYKATLAVKLPGAAGAVGHGLLVDQLKLDKEITTYLGRALDGKTVPVKSRVNSQDSYYWQAYENGVLRQILARPKGLALVKFGAYNLFVR